MSVSQKTIYALRATYELAKRQSQGPVSIAVLADVQNVPPRFLENILIQLKRAGITRSVRGREGGHLLARPARKVTVTDVLRATEGDVHPIGCLDGRAQSTCPMRDDCVFLPMWSKAQKAVLAVYDETTFEDLVLRGQRCDRANPPMYFI